MRPGWLARRLHQGRRLTAQQVADIDHALRGQLTVVIGELELVLGQDDVPSGARQASYQRAIEAAWEIERLLADWGSSLETPGPQPSPGSQDPMTTDASTAPRETLARSADAAGPAPGGRRPARGLRSRLGSLSLVTRITLVSIALIIGIGLLVNFATVSTLRRSALENQTAVVANTAATRLVPFMRPEDLHGPLSEQRYAMIDARIREAALDDPDQVGIVLWRKDGSIAYATDRSVLSRRATGDDKLWAALAGRTQRELKPATEAEIRLDRPGLDEVMEVYLPLRLGGQQVDGAFEIYHDPIRSDRQVEVVERAIGVVQTAGLGVMLLVVVFLVRGASRQLRHQSERLVASESRREVERLQTEFVGVVSHELRTPLTALVGFSELLLSPDVSEAERRQWIELLNHGAERLRHLVEGLLDVTRIDEGRMGVRLAAIDIADTVAETLATFAPAADTVEIVDTTRPGMLPPVLADRNRMVQILTNLMSNAVKYSPGGGRVVVAAGLLDGRVRVTVADQGLGIPADELPRVFSRFHRIEDEQRQGIDGSGLGLYISKRLVELQGGTMSVESPGIGLGSRFHVDLPIAPGAGRTGTGAAARGAGPSGPGGPSAAAGRVAVGEERDDR